jgi:hypothetical protein
VARGGYARAMRAREYRWKEPLAICIAFSALYCATAAERLTHPSDHNHYVHLANAWLHGRLDVGATPPGTNDWACFDTVARKACPPGRYAFPSSDPKRYRWYVSFPPLPAVVLLPIVAVFGVDTLDTLVWVLLAGLAPALLFVALRRLRNSGRSARAPSDDLLLTVLFGIGSVYYFVAVQGTVWYAAHVLGSIFVCLYLGLAVGALRPSWAGAALVLAFLCRPACLFLFPLFAVEAWAYSAGRWRAFIRRLSLFSAPVAVGVIAVMAHNVLRFDDPFEFGHRFLQVRWRSRIETWGLFDLHYLPRNLSVFFLSLPWLIEHSPFLRISRHGLALWFTTPNLVWALFPKTMTATQVGLWAAVIPTALVTLLYQNTGWVQFGYRFSLDYLPLLFALIALSGRRFGRAFVACALFSILLNTFGAVTFDRFPRFYDTDPSQQVIFQPD